MPTPASDVASSVTTITGEQLQQQHITTVSDALGMVPGLNVVQTGGLGGQTSVFIRGTNSNHVKVLIDGVDAGDPSLGSFYFDHLLTGDIARIEVLRGPQSGLYGSDAIGGVISITTKKGEGPPKATASLSGGSFGTFNQTAGLSGAQNNINYAFNVLHFRATSTPVTPLDLLAPGEKRINDSDDDWNYSTRLGADLSENLSVNLTTLYIDAKHGLTGEDYLNFATPSPEALQSTQRNHQLFTRAEAVWSLFDGKFKNTFGVNYTNQWTNFINPNPDNFTPFGSVPPPTTNVGERRKVDWRGEATLAPGQILVLGLEDQEERLRTNSTTDALGNQTTTKANWNDKAGYVELQSQFGKRFFLVANVRHDDDEAFGEHTTWRLAPALLFPETGTKLKASYGTGFKAPTLTQLFVNFPPFFVANPALKPEESTGYDAGFEQSLFAERLKFGATYYNNELKNLIGTSAADPVTFISTSVNVNQSNIHGVEAFAALAINSHLTLRGDYTYTHIDATSYAAYLRRPMHKYSVTALWRPLDPLQLSASVITVDHWADYDRSFINPVKAPGYTTVNLAATYDVTKQVQIFGRIDNLLDVQYQDPTGYLRPGFGIFGGVRVASR